MSRKASTASSGEAQVGWDPLPVTFTTLTTLGWWMVFIALSLVLKLLEGKLQFLLDRLLSNIVHPESCDIHLFMNHDHQVFMHNFHQDFSIGVQNPTIFERCHPSRPREFLLRLVTLASQQAEVTKVREELKQLKATGRRIDQQISIICVCLRMP